MLNQLTSTNEALAFSKTVTLALISGDARDCSCIPPTHVPISSQYVLWLVLSQRQVLDREPDIHDLISPRLRMKFLEEESILNLKFLQVELF